MSEVIQAFYFSTEERKLRYGDGRSISVGNTHTVNCKPECCRQGLHASVKLLEALDHAPGPILYLVELSGSIDKGSDKLAAKRRKYLAEFDASKLLREFARKQALINIDKIKPYCSSEDYKLVLKYLTTGNESLRSAASSAADSARSAACSAAYSAARSAAYSAACSAARSAAYSAACSAAYSAARSAAYSAADSAAESAACSAAYSAVYSAAANSAARSAAYPAAYPAAYSAALSAALSAANIMLTDMVRQATGWDI